MERQHYASAYHRASTFDTKMRMLYQVMSYDYGFRRDWTAPEPDYSTVVRQACWKALAGPVGTCCAIQHG